MYNEHHEPYNIATSLTTLSTSLMRKTSENSDRSAGDTVPCATVYRLNNKLYINNTNIGLYRKIIFSDTGVQYFSKLHEPIAQHMSQ